MFPLQLIEAGIREKEQEWNTLLRSLKEKEDLSIRLRRRAEILNYTAGVGELPKDTLKLDARLRCGGNDSKGVKGVGGNNSLLAALTGGATSQSYEATPLAMMTKLLTAQVSVPAQHTT